jgi:hypothetical protein
MAVNFAALKKRLLQERASGGAVSPAAPVRRSGVPLPPGVPDAPPPLPDAAGALALPPADAPPPPLSGVPARAVA